MEKEYFTLYRDGFGEYEEKKSRFLAEAHPVKSEADVAEILNDVRKKYYDASHSCYAYTLGERLQTVKASDAGEPSGTAGAPILAVLQGDRIANALIVVTRYFGGTLLGTGGLVRSYTNAAKAALSDAVIAHKFLSDILLIDTDYGGEGKIRFMADSEGLTLGEVRYTEKVSIELPVPVDETDRIRKRILDVTAGKAAISDGGQRYYADIFGKTVFFDA